MPISQAVEEKKAQSPPVFCFAHATEPPARAVHDPVAPLAAASPCCFHRWIEKTARKEPPA